ncbi:hypothetical protein HYPSUDRAFT_641398 [Hypholoma sublateritium FD-334 SS-4]|uniref:Uncharacterized protein n=1 Tax=Hypholoma sublateritium (strain FD-334 SS-4) TaxID=945553 RepID=A0A0D2L716_HYPSF|nr:hypothetical protein HYPSUDRAFT_641398 [Hypholoma sublateritium FD-334 SS-4]
MTTVPPQPSIDTGGWLTAFLSFVKSLSGHFAQTFGGLPGPGKPHDKHAEHLPQSTQPLISHAQKFDDAKQRLIVVLTVNRVCRIFTIIALGCWGGWSIMPTETKTPDSVKWVTYICIVTDWVVLSTDLDCTFLGSMDWYFRRWPEWWFLKRENMPRVAVTGYRILNTLTALALSIFVYALRDDQPIVNRINLISAITIGLGLFWLGCVESTSDSPGAWFFCTDNGPRIFYGAESAYNLATWWWIAFRTHGVVKILRNRDKPEMAAQFYILIAGLTVEFILLVWYFSIFLVPYFFKRCARWYSPVWDKHRTPLLAILASWALVIIFGLWVELPNIFFPCSGSTSLFCRILI